MATNTEKLNLVLPDGSDMVKVGELNGNFQKLDEAYGQLSEEIAGKADISTKQSTGAQIIVTDAAPQPAVRLISHIEAKQAGEGDPSFDNVRSISGFRTITVSNSDSGQTLIADLPKTEYDGSLDWGTGVVEDYGSLLTLTGEDSFIFEPSGNYYYYATIVFTGTVLKCSHLIAGSQKQGGVVIVSGQLRFYTAAKFPSLVKWKAALAEQYAAGTPVQLLMHSKNALPTQVEPQIMEMRRGTNTLQSNSGDTELEYVVDSQIALSATVENAIAPVREQAERNHTRLEGVEGDIDKLSDEIGRIAKETASANLYNKSDSGNISNKYVSWDGVLHDTANYNVSHLIKLDGNTQYTFPVYTVLAGQNTKYIPKYSADGECVGYYTGEITNDICTITTDTTSYIRVNIKKSDIDTYMVVKGDAYPSVYIPYSNHYDFTAEAKGMIREVALEASILWGKKLSVNGDSIMYGAGYTDGYAGIIATKNSMTLVNNAVSGGCIASGQQTSGGDDAHCISTSIASMPDDTDYILLSGGINDMWHDVPLGEYTDDMSVAGDTTTFYGALDTLFQSALDKWRSGQKIGFVITHKIGTTWRAKRPTSGLSFADYHEAIIKMCKKYSIPYCDVYNLSRLNTEIVYYKEAYTNNGDATHPNEAGYKLFYAPIVEAWMRTL